MTKIIIKGNFTIEGAIPGITNGVAQPFKYMELEIMEQLPVRIIRFISFVGGKSK